MRFMQATHFSIDKPWYKTMQTLASNYIQTIAQGFPLKSGFRQHEGLNLKFCAKEKLKCNDYQ